MYPMNVILIAHDETKLPDIRRELLNHGAVIENEFPHVNALVDIESSQPGQSKLFLMLVTDADDLAQLRLLRSKVNGQPIMAVVASRDADWMRPNLKSSEVLKFGNEDSSSSILRPFERGKRCEPEAQATDLFVAAMRAGAQQVVRLPLDKEDFYQALDCLSIHFSESAQSNLIAVSNAVEGCGATSLAVNLAYELGNLTNQRCILSEARLNLGSLAPYLNLQPEFTLHDVVDAANVDLFTVKKTLTPVGQHLDVACGPFQEVTWSTGTRRENLDAKMLQAFECMKRLSQWVVIDVPATFDETFFHTMGKAHTSILVVDQSILAFHHLQRLRATLTLQNSKVPVVVVVNKFDPLNKQFTLRRIQEILIGNVVYTIAFDHHIPSAMNVGEPLRLFAPKSPALHDFNQLARHIAHLPETSQRSWFSGLLHKS